MSDFNIPAIHGVRAGGDVLWSYPVYNSSDNSTPGDNGKKKFGINYDLKIDVLKKLGIIRGFGVGTNLSHSSESTAVTPYASLNFVPVYQSGLKIIGGVISGDRGLILPCRFAFLESGVGVGPEIVRSSNGNKVGVGGQATIKIFGFEVVLGDQHRVNFDLPAVKFQCGSATEKCGVGLGVGLSYTYLTDARVPY